MNKKKVLISVIACFMSTSILFTACGSKAQDQSEASKSETSQAEASNSVAEKVDMLDKYASPVEVSIAQYVDNNAQVKDGQTNEKNVWTAAYEQDYNIKVTRPFLVDSTQYDNKMNVIIASGDLPDIMAVNLAQLKQLAENDQIEDLTQIYEKYASPLTKEMISGDGNLGLNSSKFDGKLVAVPQTNDPRPSVLFIRYDWLQKLGLSEPKTMADVLKISEAFTKKDPNGNGKADTYGLALSKSLNDLVGDMAGFANGYHAYPKQWFKADDGKVAYGSIQPEMKTVLTQLQKMYKDGQLDKEFATKDSAKIGESFAANLGGMEYGQWWNPSWPLQTSMDKDPKADWRAYPIVSIDEKPAKAQFTFPTYQWYVQKKGLKNPEILVKMMNIWFEKVYSPNAEPLKYYISADGTQNFKFCPIFAWPGVDKRGHNISEALKAKDPSKLNPEEKGYYQNCLDFKAGNRSLWFNYANYGDNSAQKIMTDVYFANNSVVPPAYYGVPTQTMQEKQASLDKLENETFTKIIMGSASPDEFDKFVENWKKIGGDQITTEVNEWAAAQK